MCGKPKILCVGLDPLLNETRGLVLEKSFEVQLAGSVAEAFAQLRAMRFSLVLLCYSLPDEDCRAAVEFVHTLRARPRILALAQSRKRLRLETGDEEFQPEGPAELLAKAAAMAEVGSTDQNDLKDDPEEEAG
jgi:DNA-binding response OmpR family regulator